MNIKEMIEQLDNEVKRIWRLYCDAHNNINIFADRNLTKEEIAILKQEVIKKQMAYDMLHPAFNYVASMNDFSLVAMDDWKKFAEKMSGTINVSDESLNINKKGLIEIVEA